MSELSLVLVLVVGMNSGHRDSQRGSDTSRGALGLIWRGLYPGGFVPQICLYRRWFCSPNGFVPEMGLLPSCLCTWVVLHPTCVCTQVDLHPVCSPGLWLPPWAVRGAEGPCRGCQTRDPSPGRGHARVSSGWAGGESQLRVCG